MQKHTACNWSVMEEDTACVIPVPCGIQDGMLKKKCPIVVRQMATPPLSYILFKKTIVVILK